MIAELSKEEIMEVEGLDFKALETLESKTDLWLEKKRGRFSGSEFHRLMGYEDKDVFPDGAETYAIEKAIETLVTEVDYFSNDDMDRGNNEEFDSVQFFMEVTGLKVEKYATEQEFFELGMHVGCTPDGLIGDDGLIEGKNPKSKTHFFYLTNLKTVEDFKKHCKNYYWQVQGNMYVTDRKYCYFYSFDNRFKDPKHKLFLLKVERNDTDIEKLKVRIQKGIKSKLEHIKKLNG